MHTEPSMRRFPLTLLLLVAVCALCYMAGIGNFYLFDSRVWLERNPALKIASPSFPALYEAVLSGVGSGPLGRPLAMLTFAVESVLSGGMHPAVSKCVNIALHAINGLFLHALLRLLVRHSRMPLWPGVREAPEALALAVTALWILHPLHVSTVLYDVQRMTMLSSMAILAGLIQFVRWRTSCLVGPADAARSARVVIAIAGLTVAGTLAKESGILLPWFVALLELYCFGGHYAGRERIMLRRICWAILLLPPALVLGALAVEPAYLMERYTCTGCSCPTSGSWRSIMTTLRCRSRCYSPCRRCWRSSLGYAFCSRPGSCGCVGRCSHLPRHGFCLHTS
jgi:hypothetical protein